MSEQLAKEYLTQKHNTLSHDYKTPCGRYREHCGLLALEVAQLLIEAGKEPYILSIRGKTIDSVGNRKPLIPKIFEGRVVWGGHQVCCVENSVFDPMIGEPIEIEHYIVEAFYDPVETKLIRRFEEIQEL